MAVECGPTFGVCRVRLTRVDSNGNVIAGDNSYVTDAPISVAVNTNKETGNSFTQRNGCGCGIARRRMPDIFNWWEFVLTMATDEPVLEAFLLGAETIEDGSDTVGVAYPSAISCDQAPPAVAFEFWVQRILGSGQDGTFPWEHFVYPMTFWSKGDTTYEEDFAKPPFDGFSQTNSNWGDGPYSDGPPDGQEIAEGGHWSTDIEPPDAECAAQPVTSTS